MRFTGHSMLPNLPPRATLRAQIVALDNIEQLPPGVYVVILADKRTGQVKSIPIGRLKQVPEKGKLVLWPDNPEGGVKITIRVQDIHFVFRITHYEPLEGDEI